MTCYWISSLIVSGHSKHAVRRGAAPKDERRRWQPLS